MSAQITTFTVTFGVGPATTLVCNKPTGTADGDKLIAIHFADPDDSATEMTAPAGWSQSGSTQALSGAGSCKVWIKTASSEGSTYTFGIPNGSDSTIYILRVTNANTISVNPTFGGSATSATNHVAPSVTPTNADSLVICAWMALNLNAGSTSWGSTPSPLTNLNTVDQANASPYIRSRVAYAESQPASAFGTKTIVHSISRAWIALSFVVSAGSTPIAGSDTETLGDANAAVVSPLVTDSFAISDPTPSLSNTLVASDAGALTDSATISPLVSDTQTLTETSSVSVTLVSTDTETLSETSSVSVTTVGSDTETLSDASSSSVTFDRPDTHTETETSLITISAIDSQTLSDPTPAVLDSTEILATPDTHTLSELSSLFITTHKDVTDTLTQTEGGGVLFATPNGTETHTLIDLTPSFVVTTSRTETHTLGEAFELLSLLSRADTHHLINISSINFPPIPRRIYATAETQEIIQEITKVEFFGSAFVIVSYGGTVETVHDLSGSVLED